MTDWILANEPVLRFGAFAAIFAAMALWELFAARRELYHSKGQRWLANLGIAVVDALLVRLLFPAAAVGFALLAERQGWGLLNHFALPYAASVAVSVALLDLAIYLQHVMFHAVPALWRLHMVHHADQDFDFTTGVRFHPIEIVLSMVIKFTVISALGTPPLGVFLFEVLLNGTSMFNHGNVSLPPGFDRYLRWLLVTPDMHRVHHSVELDESNSNFGFNLPWWDRLFGTYRPQPRAGHDAMVLGVEHLRQPKARSLAGLLLLPFAALAGRYSISRRYSRDDDRTQG